MNEKQLNIINENNLKILAVLEAASESLTCGLNVDVTSLVDIAKDYCNSTAEVLSGVI